jgi:hypothetical protein
VSVVPLNGTCFQVDEVYLNQLNTPKLTVGAIPGPGGANVPFLVTEVPTLSAGGIPVAQIGTTKLEFELPVMSSADDKAYFVVDSVLHVPPAYNDWQGSAGVIVTPQGVRQLVVPALASDDDNFEQAAWGQWSFPDTKEARAEVQDP